MIIKYSSCKTITRQDVIEDDCEQKTSDKKLKNAVIKEDVVILILYYVLNKETNNERMNKKNQKFQNVGRKRKRNFQLQNSNFLKALHKIYYGILYIIWYIIISCIHVVSMQADKTSQKFDFNYICAKTLPRQLIQNRYAKQ